jgi:AcrR family transcriptional regulator
VVDPLPAADDAVTLFVDRGDLRPSRFVAEGENRAAVERICQRLDRSPLLCPAPREMVDHPVKRVPIHASKTCNLNDPRPVRLQPDAHLDRPRTARALAVLEELEALYKAEGFAHFTAEELAARLRCSRRMLYQLAPSLDELAALVVDRFFQQMGVTCYAKASAGRTRTEQLDAFVELGVQEGEFTAMSSSFVARMFLAGLLRLLDPQLLRETNLTVPAAIDQYADLILEGIRRR